VAAFYPGEEKELTLTLKNHSAAAKGAISLNAPKGWRVAPEKISFEFDRRLDEKTVAFRVRPLPGANTVDIRAVLSVGGNNYSLSFAEIDYRHVTTQVIFPDASLRVVSLEAKAARGRIGYIMGSGDDMPEILKDMGYDILMLDDDMLNQETLSGLDVVVAGIRAYNTRQRLRFAHPLLMEFVRNGGTYIVQYNVNTGLQTAEIGPYPFAVGRNRISEEDAGLRFLAPSHSLMNRPNAITKTDFDGWVQERGLYFLDQWDARYTPLFAGNDTGEGELSGSTLFCQYGEGVYIYTSLAFFRQLPAGVPGAFRLFQNMMAAGK
jgi:hypothetical protein